MAEWHKHMSWEEAGGNIDHETDRVQQLNNREAGESDWTQRGSWELPGERGRDGDIPGLGKEGTGTKCAEKRWRYRRGGAAAVTD